MSLLSAHISEMETYTLIEIFQLKVFAKSKMRAPVLSTCIQHFYRSHNNNNNNNNNLY